MNERRRAYLGGVATLAIGIALGAVLSGGGRPALLMAGAGDYPDASLVTTGSVGVELDAGKTPLSKDAVYYLNYSRGTLMAAVPFPLMTPGSSRMLSDFAERDLIADFRLKPRQRCHFTMTVGSAGTMNGGVALLYVFETITGQMVVYQVNSQFTAGSTRPVINLVERRVDPRFSLSEAVATNLGR